MTVQVSVPLIGDFVFNWEKKWLKVLEMVSVPLIGDFVFNGAIAQDGKGFNGREFPSP